MEMNIREMMTAHSEGTLSEITPWFDWFCKKEALPRRAEKLWKILDKICNSTRFDASKTYVFFKNNQPAFKSGTYDSLSICDIETGNVLFWISPKDGHTGKAQVFDRSVGFDAPAVQGTVRDVYRYFQQ